MDLTQLANLGEFIGGVAVLVTLVYLAVQVRQGRNDLRLSSENHLADYIADRAFTDALTPDIARILEISLTSPENLGDDEARRAMWIAASYLHGIERMYVSYLEGVVSKEMWTPHERIVMGLLRAPFTRKWWATEQNLAYTDRFRAFVNQRIGDSAESDSWRMTSPDDYAQSPS